MIIGMGKIFTPKAFWVVANLACTAVLAFQLAHVLEGYIRPTITRTWEEEVPLQEIDFPLVVKICVVPGFNQTALYEAGYQETYSYFGGQSRFNNTLFGWAGHTEDSGTLGTVEDILAQVTDNETENIFDRIFVWTKDENDILDDFDIAFEHLKASTVNYPNNCRSLALSSIPELEGKRIQQLGLQVGDLGNYTIEVNFHGDTLDCRRNIKELHSFQSTGDAIKLMHKDLRRAYIVDISQRVFVEEDPTNTCRNYPNEEYLSYQECDDQFLRDHLPAGLMPVWMTEDFADVSTQVYDQNWTSHLGEWVAFNFFSQIFHTFQVYMT